MELSAELKREMFWTMLLARRVDERAWVLHRQGRIAFHISGIGHEVAQVGAAFALRRGHDWVTPYYRDLALLMAMGMTPREFMLSLMGKREEPSSDLDAPVRRLGGPDVPAVPFSHPMQDWFMLSVEKILHAIRDLAAY